MTKDGWLCVKLIKTNLNGIPDLLCLRNNEAVFIEVKQQTGTLSEIQKYRIKQLKEHGFKVKVWTDYEFEFGK